jgi:N utilization substance protein A
VQTVSNELGGEKIDIIEWSEDPIKFIAQALQPAKILNVQVDYEEKSAKVGVLEDQLSLAIGKSGQNVRLAARLTEWKIDINGEKIASNEESAEAVGETSDEAASEESEKAVDSADEATADTNAASAEDSE